MLGLSGCVWAGPLMPEVDAMSNGLRRAVTVSTRGSVIHDEGAGFRVTLTTNTVESDASQPAVAADGSVRVFFDGWFERPAVVRHVPMVNHALNTFRDGGVDALRRLNGIYNVVVCETRLRRTWIVSSRHSYLPVFYVVQGNALFFASEIRALLSAGVCKSEILDRECIAWLLFGRYLRDETKFRNVKLLPGGSCLSWSDGKSEIDTLPAFQYQSDGTVSEERLVDDLSETFRSAVRRRMDETERVALGLSGGFDSRLILGAVDPQRRRDLFAFTWGDAGNDDVRIAAKVARSVDVHHQEYVVDHSEYINRARDGVWLSDGLSLFMHGFYPGVYARVREDSGASAVFNGVGLDVLLGGLFLDREAMSEIHTRGELVAHYRQKLTTFTRDEIVRMCKGDGAACFDDAVETLESRVNEIAGDRISDVNDQFHFETRTRRWIALAFPLVRESLDTIAPCYDDDFLGAVARVAPAQRFNRSLYVKLLARINPELSRIEYQKTMMPACIPSEYWRPFVELEQRKEQAHYELWKKSRGAVYVPYKHYPQNFVEWYRVHPEWRDFLRRTLLGRDSVLIDRYFEKTSIEGMIEDHIHGRRNCFRQLNLLLSLELFLQIFTGQLTGASAGE